MNEKLLEKVENEIFIIEKTKFHQFHLKYKDKLTSILLKNMIVKRRQSFSFMDFKIGESS